MKLPYFEVAAFTACQFRGNPAGVCPLGRWPGDALLQKIAAENNLAETAFFCPRGDDYDLRWFTPTTEVDLCGHATLASAFVAFFELGRHGDTVRFHSRSGPLSVTREGSILTLDFPSRSPEPCVAPEPLLRGLGGRPAEILKARDYMAVFASAGEVSALRPDFELLRQVQSLGVIATAPGTDCEFVSRFFAPAAGIPEDPVTGSAHCTLIPYWSRRLGKAEMFARQVSSRGGALRCRLVGDRVHIGGEAVMYLRGELQINDSEL
jgi:PhzF family phenazine biosynthesis protein